MTEQHQLSDQDQRELAALADGSLPSGRRERLEGRIASEPGLRAAFELQRSAVSVLRGLDVSAPAGLRERIETERTSPSRPVRRRRLGIGGAIAGGVAAAALAAVLVLPSGSGGPTVVEAAKLSQLPATQAEVPVDRANPKLLDAEQSGVPYPNLEKEFEYRQAGLRHDRIEGRDSTTVFYEDGGERIGYTILSGDAIDPPKGSLPTTVNDVDLSSTTNDDGSQIVTWLRDGRTCVLSGKGVSRAELLELASWKGDGAVPF